MSLGVKLFPFPLTLHVGLTTVHCNRAACDTVRCLLRLCCRWLQSGEMFYYEVGLYWSKEQCLLDAVSDVINGILQHKQAT